MQVVDDCELLPSSVAGAVLLASSFLAPGRYDILVADMVEVGEGCVLIGSGVLPT